MLNVKEFIRNKKTEEIRTVISYSSSHTIDGGETLNTIDKDGVIEMIERIPDKSDWEFITADYQGMGMNLIGALESSFFGRKLLNIFARRADKDYFTPGAVVHIVDPYYTNSGGRSELYEPYYDVIKSSFIIHSIIPDQREYEEGKYFVRLIANPGRKEDIDIGELDKRVGNFSYSIPLWIYKIEQHDAFCSLKRYDKPY